MYSKKVLANVADVKEFFGWLLDEGINFHPEDSFSNYINVKTKGPSFSKEVADELDGLMDQAWKICENYDIDICALSCEVAWPKLFGTKYDSNN